MRNYRSERRNIILAELKIVSRNIMFVGWRNYTDGTIGRERRNIMYTQLWVGEIMFAELKISNRNIMFVEQWVGNENIMFAELKISNRNIMFVE